MADSTCLTDFVRSPWTQVGWHSNRSTWTMGLLESPTLPSLPWFAQWTCLRSLWPTRRGIPTETTEGIVDWIPRVVCIVINTPEITRLRHCRVIWLQYQNSIVCSTSKPIPNECIPFCLGCPDTAASFTHRRLACPLYGASDQTLWKWRAVKLHLHGWTDNGHVSNLM